MSDLICDPVKQKRRLEVWVAFKQAIVECQEALEDGCYEDNADPKLAARQEKKVSNTCDKIEDLVQHLLLPN